MLDTLVLVRHGEAEHNVLFERITNGEHLPEECEALNRRGSMNLRLTARGVSQAKAAGLWIRDNVAESFSRHYVADLSRTKETAALLGLKEAKWWLDPGLREREFGLFDVFLPEKIREESQRLFGRRKSHDHDLLSAPPNGESWMQHIIRASLSYETMHWGVKPGESAIMVTSEGTIWALRIRIERLTQDRFKRLIASENPRNEIHNGQVIVYTLINPKTKRREGESFAWTKSICPWDMSLSPNNGRWRKIIRPSFSNEDLLRQVCRKS